jgi:hypothetical protein
MIELSECQSLRMNWEQYGTVPPKNYELVVKKFKDKYKDGGCGKDVLLEKCEYIEGQIENYRSSINESLYQNKPHWVEIDSRTLAQKEEEFKQLNCAKKIEELKQLSVKSTFDKYSNMDKERIEAENKYQINLRIFISVSVLVLGLAVILVNRK